jgi:colanic acid biosynthesis glycosyl transferase WcaI
MGRVVFFNRFYWPDESATAQLLTDLAEGLALEGWQVEIVTSRLNYADASARYRVNEAHEGVHIHRVWSTGFGRAGLLGRLLDYLTVYLSFLIYLLKEIPAGTTVVMKTDPPLLSILGAFAAQFRPYSLVAWNQDLFPEVASCMGGIPRGALPLAAGLASLRDWSLRCCQRVVVLGEDMRAYLEGRGIASQTLQTIGNWAVQETESSEPEAGFRNDWGVPHDAVLLGYSGNLGRAHDWSTLREAALDAAVRDGLHFSICGGGHGYPDLQAAVKGTALEAHFHFLPYQPRDFLGTALKIPDAHWISLKAAQTPFILPSKFYGVLEAGRPLVFIGDPTSKLAQLVENEGLGFAVAEGDVSRLREILRDLVVDRAGWRARGLAARRYWETHCRREKRISVWGEMLTHIKNEQLTG